MRGTRTAALVGGVSLALTLTACGDDDKGDTIDVTLAEFSVSIPEASVTAGDYTITAKNAGGAVHELVVMRASASDITTTADGEADEESVPEADHLGEVEDVAPGTSKSFSVTLTPGHYIMFCNLKGTEGVHYQKGMHAEFDVT